MPNATLIVMRVMTDDVGQYECQADNLMGSSVANILVSYRGEAGVSHCVCVRACEWLGHQKLGSIP